MFLVDPAVRKPSSTTVSPGQKEWQTDAIDANPVLKGAFNSLLPDPTDGIASLAEGIMSRKEAEEYRLELMDERTVFVAQNDEKFFAVAFSMCEH